MSEEISEAEKARRALAPKPSPGPACREAIEFEIFRLDVLLEGLEQLREQALAQRAALEEELR